MNEHSYLPDFNDDDVIDLNNDNIVKMKKLRDAIIQTFSNDMEPHLRHILSKKGIQISEQIDIENANGQKIGHRNNFLDEGVYCKLLELGDKAWKSGKIRIRVSVDFYPDEPDIQQPKSPLDEIRQTIN